MYHSQQAIEEHIDCRTYRRTWNVSYPYRLLGIHAGETSIDPLHVLPAYPSRTCMPSLSAVIVPYQRYNSRPRAPSLKLSIAGIELTSVVLYEPRAGHEERRTCRYKDPWP